MDRVMLLNLAAVFLLIFGALSAVDGVYLHLWRYRLHERRESRFEHAMHTWRSVLFIPILLLLFRYDAAGVLLWAAVLFLGIDLAVEACDALSERASRAFQGGLPSHEYLLHLMLTTVRAIAIALVLASKPESAWAYGPEMALGDTYPVLLRFASAQLLPGSLLVSGLHILLALRPRSPGQVVRKVCGALISSRTPGSRSTSSGSQLEDRSPRSWRAL